MMRLIIAAVLSFGLVLPAFAQAAEKTPVQQAMVRTWNGFINKVIAMAEDTGYPEEKFDSRPHPDARSFAEELRHVAYVTRDFAARARGEQADFRTAAAKEKEPATRAEMVAALKEASAEFVNVLEERERPDLIGFLAGMSEHYGKLVTIYRMNGIVPPRSRR